MTICCPRRDDQKMPLSNDSNLSEFKNNWLGHLISFNCGGSRATGPCSLIALAIASVANVFFTQILINSEFDDSPRGFLSMFGVITMILTTTCMEGTTRCCTRSRICISPAILMTALAVSSLATLLGTRGNADHEIIRYENNKLWVNATNQAIEESCISNASLKLQNWTLDECELCDLTTGTLDTFMDGPYQSILSTPFFLESIKKIEDCNLPPSAKNFTLSANRSEPGRDYLCGLPFTSSSALTTSTMLEEECLFRYISEKFCLFPPLYLQGYVSSNGLSLRGFVSIHISVFDRCLPENAVVACLPYRGQCDTPEAIEFFDEIQKRYEEVRKDTLSYPSESYLVLEMTRAFVIPAALLTSAITIGSSIYEFGAFQRFHQTMLNRVHL